MFSFCQQPIFTKSLKYNWRKYDGRLYVMGQEMRRQSTSLPLIPLDNSWNYLCVMLPGNACWYRNIYMDMSVICRIERRPVKSCVAVFGWIEKMSSRRATNRIHQDIFQLEVNKKRESWYLEKEKKDFSFVQCSECGIYCSRLSA